MKEKDIIKGENEEEEFWKHKTGEYQKFSQPDLIRLGHLVSHYKEYGRPLQLKFEE